MFDLLSIEPGRFLLAFVVVVVASIPQALTGMGFGLLAASTLLLVDATLVPATVIVMGTVVAAANALSRIHDIDSRDLGFALAGRLPGIGLALAVLGFIANRETFAVLIAVVILFAVLLSVVDVSPRKSTVSLLIAGAASGVAGTLTAVGAPPMGIVYQKEQRLAASATLNAYFAIGGLMSAVAVWSKGWLGWRDILLALALLPGLAAGTWISRYLSAFADRNVRPAILWICAVSAVAVLWKNLA